MFDELGLRVVDEIHHYAEPLTGETSVLQSHTMHSVDTTPCTVFYAMVYNQRRSIQWQRQLVLDHILQVGLSMG